MANKTVFSIQSFVVKRGSVLALSRTEQVPSESGAVKKADAWADRFVHGTSTFRSAVLGNGRSALTGAQRPVHACGSSVLPLARGVSQSGQPHGCPLNITVRLFGDSTPPFTIGQSAPGPCPAGELRSWSACLRRNGRPASSRRWSRLWSSPRRTATSGFRR